MKKTSSIILILAMLLTSLLSLFAVGVSAEANYSNGDVIIKYNNADYFAYCVKYYEDDATAKAAGMVAKVNVTDVNGNACVGYVDTFSHVLGLSGQRCVAGNVDTVTGTQVECPKEFTFIVEKVDINSTSNYTLSAGGRGIILKGMPNGTTIDAGSIRLNLECSNDIGFTFENITITTAGAKSSTVQLQSGTKVTLNNGAKITSANSVIADYGTVILQGNSTLTMNEGSSVVNYAPKGSVGDDKGAGIRLNADGASLVMNGGKIQVGGTAIRAVSGANGEIKINNAEITSSYKGLYVTVGKTITIENTTIASEIQGIHVDAAASHLTINNSNVTSNTKAAVYKANTGRLAITGGTFTSVANSDKATIVANGSNGSDFQSTKNITGATINAPAGNTALYLQNGKIEYIKNCTINGGVYFYGGVTGLENSTVTAKGNIPALTVGASTTYVVNCDISAENASAIYLKLDNASYPSAIALTDVNAVSSGADAITADDGGKYYVNSGSFMGKGDVAAAYVSQAEGKTGYAVTFNGNLSDAFDTADLMKGASVRTAADSSGIRFQSTITKAAVTALENVYGAGSLTFGTLIAPYDYLTSTGGVFTKEALAAKELKCIQLDADKGLHDMGDYYLINAAMIDVKPENYGRDFVAVPYVTITTANGTVTVYGTYDAEDNVRSIREVAYAALGDVLYVGQTLDVEGQTVTVDEAYIASKTTYANKVTTWYEFNGTSWEQKTGEAYTEYSTDQRNVIDDYIA